MQILDGWRREILNQTGSKDDFGPNEVSIRLSSRYGLNDPTEHLHAPRKIRGRPVTKKSHGRLVFPDTAFVYCGAKAAENEVFDRLDLWRAYGADGNGIAITTAWSKAGLVESGLDVIEVEYVNDSELGPVNTI